jgi:hypothetical protein
MKQLLLIALCLALNCTRQENAPGILYSGTHEGIGVVVHQRQEDARSSESPQGKYYVLRVSQKGMKKPVFDYLSFRNEPYLSQSIHVVLAGDTVHPLLTHVERPYEAGMEFVYLMLVPIPERGSGGSEDSKAILTVPNFLWLGDTLRAPFSFQG